MPLHQYLPQDRLRALAQGRALPVHTAGAALFADISGFTALTEALAQRHGERRGVEALTLAIGQVYDALIVEIERRGGSVLAFAGDAITCWFDGSDDAALRAPAAARAVQAAVAMQAAMAPARHDASPLALKVSVASGPAQRFTVGDAAIQTLDVLAGSTVARVAMADGLARPGDILLDADTAAAAQARVLEWRTLPSGAAFAWVDPAWRGPRADHVPDPDRTPPAQPAAEQLRPWVLPFVFERESTGQGLFVTDLRPVVALFLRFGTSMQDAEEAADLDDDAMHRLDQWISGAQRVLQQQGGVLLELTIGDKGSYLYAAFGAAQAHEDDARRALRAALALRALHAEQAQPGSVTVGLASGTLRVGGYGGRSRQSFGAQGDAVNAAARLMMLARPGEILTSGRVRGAVAQEFALQARPPIALKGKAEPMPVFAVQGLQRQRALRLQASDFVLPVVGRDRELQQLDDALAQAAQAHGAVWAVVAEAGMGKSRLLAEGVRMALRRAFVGYGGAAWGDGVRRPYQAWQGVWTALLDLDPAQSPRVQARTVEFAVLRMAPDHAEAWPLLGAVLGLALPDNAFTAGLAPKDRKALLEQLLVQLLAAAAADAALDGGGVLLLLDDLNDIDPLSLDLLAAVAPALATLPVLLLTSQRPPAAADEVDVADCLTRLAAAPVQRIGLGGLDAAQAEQLIRAQVAAQYPERAGAVSPALIARVIERAQGNPSCIEELLNHLRDRGLDPRRADAAQALDWPVSLHRLVLSRVDRLSGAQQSALKVASVIGRRFTVATVQACSPVAVDPAALQADLQALAQLGLTSMRADGLAAGYEFRHQMTMEVAYDSLAHPSRVRLHERVAQHLEAVAGDDAAGQAAALAHHWARADRPDRAWPHLRRVGDQAAAQYANDEALAAWTQVLAWLPADALAERVELLLRREALHDLLGQHDERRRDLAALDELAARLPDPADGERLRRRVALRRAALALDLGDFTVATAQAEAAHAAHAAHAASPTFDAARDNADHAQEVDAWLLSARALFAAGQGEAARAPLAQALHASLERGLVRGAADARAQLGLVEWQAGHYDAAESLLQQALPGLEQMGDLRRQLDVLNNLGVVAKSRARFAQAVAHYEQAQALARRIGDRSGEAMMFNNMGSAWLAAGDCYRAGQDADRAARIWSALHEQGRLGTALLNRGEAHRELGQYDAAQTKGEQALALLRASGQRRAEATVLENLGRVAVAQGDAPRARQHFDAALALSREIGLRAIEASTSLDIGRLCLALGDAAGACQALEGAAALIAELGDPIGTCEVQAARAALALGEATTPDAAQAEVARGEVEPLLPRLLHASAEDAALPMTVYATACRVLCACGDARAAALLERSRAVLRERAARIPDPAARRDYLQVAEHRALLSD